MQIEYGSMLHKIFQIQAPYLNPIDKAINHGEFLSCFYVGFG